ncbi:MAG: spore germination protein [Eubacteriaceae bacterium]|nr:spore germination protein [Eubacteriaceae bacterium]
MIGFIRKIHGIWELKKINSQISSQKKLSETTGKDKITANLEKNKETMVNSFNNSDDFISREITLPFMKPVKAILFYIDGLCDGSAISNNVLRPMLVDSRKITRDRNIRISRMGDLMEGFVPGAEACTTSAFSFAVQSIASGDCALFIDGLDESLIINTKGWEKRSISEPPTETVVRGSREGFTENFRTNTALLRRRLKAPGLRLETLTIGDRTQTTVGVMFIEGIANRKIVDEIKRRLGNIFTDAIITSGYVEEFIEEHPHSLFATTGYSERPDVVAGKLLEGRVAIIIDGAPFVLTAPMLFLEHMQVIEDYTSKTQYATFVRILRFAAFVVSISTPALFVAISCYHQELIPTPLLYTMIASSEGLPFPTIIETIVMLIIYELIREAGVRLPKPVGQAVSIVGALVMGQAAFEAGVVGAPVVIIIALTAVASFISPFLNEATTIIRWFLLLLSGVMGGLGFGVGAFTLLIHIASIKSYSVPYLHPLAPLSKQDLKDSFYRTALWKMRKRPLGLNSEDIVRQNMDGPATETNNNGEGLNESQQTLL